MKIGYMLIIFLSVSNLFAQKPALDTTVYKKWPSLGPPILTADGNYVKYTIENQPLGSRTLVVQSTKRNWKKEFVGSTAKGMFTDDGKNMLFKNGNDSLMMLSLGSDIVKFVSRVSFFSLKTVQRRQWIFYSKPGFHGTYFLSNLEAGKPKVFNDVVKWNFSDDGSVLILWKKADGNSNYTSLHCTDLLAGNDYEIPLEKNVDDLIIDPIRKQLAIRSGNFVWHYVFGDHKKTLVFNKKSEKDWSLERLDSFSKDGRRLFVYLKKGVLRTAEPNPVEIWSYRDTILQSELQNHSENHEYLAVIELNSHKISRLQRRSEEQFMLPKSVAASDTNALVEYSLRLDEPWNLASKTCWYLVSTKNGNRKRIPLLDNNRTVSFSFLGKFLIYFDLSEQNYYSYEITTGVTRNLTNGLRVSWTDIQRDDLPKRYPREFSSVVWESDDQAVYVYDRHDIWKLDPLNRKMPINVTNGYGKRNEIVFNFALSKYQDEGVQGNTKLYLSAFNTRNKNNGFFIKAIEKSGDPSLSVMGPYIFNTNSGYVSEDMDFSPVCAKNADVFIVRRMGSSEAPNYFTTKDFKHYIKLTSLEPEKNYNWYTTELHEWTALDGRQLQGILYKPQNFDPLKKYPIILYYYERKSDGLNSYLRPDVLGDGGGTINIPTYVSNDYLVFCPDIFYRIGEPMQGTYDSIVSAASYLSRFSFVNPQKMALHGNSFGGFQTNYLVTHTNLFAAAVSSSGLADIVSNYGNLASDGSSRQNFYETGQTRIGETLWDNPEAYVLNSPIFNIDKITTPLLIMHTKQDGVCPYTNILEFFTGLRRLGKKAWMLVYSKGNHAVYGSEASDFSKRMMQFFDHYLKGKPAPIWMTKGIGSETGRSELGYEYDLEISTPGQGLPRDYKK